MDHGPIAALNCISNHTFDLWRPPLVTGKFSSCIAICFEVQVDPFGSEPELEFRCEEAPSINSEVFDSFSSAASNSVADSLLSFISSKSSPSSEELSDPDVEFRREFSSNLTFLSVSTTGTHMHPHRQCYYHYW